MTNRLFIALDLPEFIVDEITEIRKSIYNDESIRWESKEKLHITLKFLGDVKTELIPAFSQTLETVCSDANEIELKYKSFGYFYRNRNPKILWLGFDYDDNLINLNNRINETFEQFGFEREKRKFKPHITLLRIRGRENRKKLDSFLDFELPERTFTCSSVTLFKSDLIPSGSVYTKIEKFKLKT